MYRRVAGWVCLFLLYTAVAGEPGTPLSRILSLYRQSDRLFHLSNSTPVMDSTALAGFSTIIGELEKTGDFTGRDTLLFQSWLKKAILLDSRSDYKAAKDAYRRALGFHNKKDSLLFLTYINIGGTYYNLNHFDSADYFLLRADSITGEFRGQEDEVRLYNTLGVLYFDNGNYRQSKNYFNQALEIVEGKKPFDTASATSLQNNIAASFYHIGSYEEALTIYKKLLSYHVYGSYVHINMGNAYIGLDKYKEALACFRKVDVKKIPDVLNEMAYAQLKLNRPDSCAWFLDRLLAKYRDKTISPNELDLGVNHVYRAGLLTEQKEYMPALTSLQQAIIIFSRHFSNADIYRNPTSFLGTFAYYRLFDALLKKAEVFMLLYKTSPDKGSYLEAAYDTYQSALSLLRFIEKSYDTDDAKLFLKKKSGQAYEGALSACLELSKGHPEKDYVRQAFMISEKSKASVITANLEENTFARAPGLDPTLLQNERNIKYNIARLNVRSEETSDKKELEALDKEKTDYEVALSRLQKQLEQNGTYYRLKYEDSGQDVGELQRRLENNQALISFYAAGNALHAFIVTKRDFRHIRIDSLSRLEQDAEAWLDALKTTENGRKFKAGNIGERLYQTLIKPIQQQTGSKDEWIIIPDGFLFFLPFESLPAGDGTKTLLETTTISYRLSSRMLTSPAGAASSSPIRILSFAPFASGGQGSAFPALPASGEEIADLPGARYLNGKATKTQFLKEINKYPIVHLATHAISSPVNAAGSFIAFFPVKHAPIEDCLYLEELYGLDMNATRLVIISACETGQGELVAKEGVISLSRAFAYAGCASTINSLWKADDKATSYILQRFYIHLQKGYSKAKALQQAKLDYLSSDALNKSPAFWAHLILMGDTAPVYTQRMSFLWTLLLVPVGAIVVWGMKKKRKSRRSQGRND
ncbi:MAG TPA: CHAT domain-containing tetratricopeptide repeat protein [Puia sp.]|nr:CHAT domain-containing tetratricopeptide repeat protein [Puia sp.]